MAFLAGVVKPRSGLVLTPDKGYLVQSRLGPVARKENYASVAELLQALRLRRDERLAWAITDALTNNETFFFRDRAPFEQFRDVVLPVLAAARQGGSLAVWSAPVARRAGAYSLAMLMEEARDASRACRWTSRHRHLARGCWSGAGGIYTQFEVQRGLPIAC
jgi:chemotaxis protein methyltransferase CheR